MNGRTLTKLLKGEEEAEEVEDIGTPPQARREAKAEAEAPLEDLETEMTDHRSHEKGNPHRNQIQDHHHNQPLAMQHKGQESHL